MFSVIFRACKYIQNEGIPKHHFYNKYTYLLVNMYVMFLLMNAGWFNVGNLRDVH